MSACKCYAVRMEMDESDESLMLRYAAGDAAAFESLYARHKAPLYRYVLRQVECGIADELYQDIWLNLIHARDGYEPSAKFTTWLYRIARNRIIDFYRRQSIRPVSSDTAAVETTAGRDCEQPEQRIETQDKMKRLLAAIADLPREQKDVFLLREQAGLDMADIADLTGASFEAAKSRLRYALKRLRRALDGTS
jgi:RNA polymerase sigma-70 factor, ECF subfamily